MIKKISFILTLFFLLFTSVNSVSCQYTEEVQYKNPILMLFYEDFPTAEPLGKTISYSNFYNSDSYSSFKISNNMHKEIEVYLFVRFLVTEEFFLFPDENHNLMFHEKITILPFQTKTIEISMDNLDNDYSNYRIIENTMYTNIKYGDETLLEKIGYEYYTKTECETCGDSQCYNDGSSCNYDYQCGGNFCVENICSNWKNCYNGDCKCDVDEVQCFTNDACVTLDSKQIGQMPICSKLECESNFINEMSGLCIEDPIITKLNNDKLTEELKKKESKENIKLVFYFFIIFSLISAIIYIFYLYLNYKKRLLNESMIKSIQNDFYEDIELIKNDSDLSNIKKNKKIIFLEKQIKNLEKDFKKSNYIKDLNINYTFKDITYITSSLDKIKKSLENKGVVRINGVLYKQDENGYLKKLNSTTLYHRWIGFEHIWNKKIHGKYLPYKYEIHHIDRNKLNNFTYNLIFLSKVDHKKVHNLIYSKEYTDLKALKKVLTISKEKYSQYYLDNFKTLFYFKSK